MIRFTRTQESFLLALAVFGFLVPNGIFVYAAFSDPGALTAALKNPIAEVFMAEAGILMLLFAWLIHRSGIKRPGWGLFLVMSLVGSMAFSVPMFLFLASREPGKKD